MRTTYMYRVSAGFAHAAAILGAGWMLMFGTAPAHADQLPREFVGNYCGTTSDPNNGSPIEFYRKSPRCKKGAAYVRLTSDRLFMPDEVTEIACVLDHIISVNRHGTTGCCICAIERSGPTRSFCRALAARKLRCRM